MNDRLAELRRELHRSAELSGEERETARLLAERLGALDPSRLIRGLGGEGLVAIFEGCSAGPTLLLRADMDALPIDEGRMLPHHSRRAGVAHKCGHDGHMAMLVGAAERFASQPPEAGRVALLFQPAEETGAGAKAVLEDDAFSEVRPDIALALHNLPGFPLGQVVLREGPMASASRGLVVSFEGASSHAAEPERGRSPALAVSQTIQAWSAVPQFDTAFRAIAQVTVIQASVGTRAFGTSPGRGTVAATLRARRDEVIEQLEERLLTLARGLAATYELELSVERADDFPATLNDAAVVREAEAAAGELGLSVTRPAESFAWSEDFGHFTRACRGALLGLGSGLDQPALHHPDYDFPDALTPQGVSLLAATARRLLVADLDADR
jgi:amidohydrolase